MKIRTLTHEEFLNKFYKKNKHAQDIEILGTYINTRTKIKCKCKIDGYEWSPRPNDLLRGHGCPKCGGTAKLTHEEFMEKFNKQNTHAKDIEILGTYINNHTKILCRCKIDGYEWTPVADSLLQGCGCPKCVGTAKLTQKEFINKLHQINPNIEVLGTYVNAQTKINCRCKIDGYKWEAKPGNLLNGHGCPQCVVITPEKFIQRFNKLNPCTQDIELLGDYMGALNKIKCKCKIDGYEWEAAPSNLLRGTGCPKCNTSKGEKRIAQYLDNLCIDYLYNTGYFKNLISVNGRPLRPDFIIPSLKIWIEFDGQQHFEPVDFTGAMSEQQLQEQFKIVLENDQIKNQYAKANNWILVRIPYWDYDNIEQILAAYIEQEQAI